MTAFTVGLWLHNGCQIIEAELTPPTHSGHIFTNFSGAEPGTPSDVTNFVTFLASSVHLRLLA